MENLETKVVDPRPNILIDFDGVIHNPLDREEGYSMGKPYPETRETLLKIANQYRIVIYTTRNNSNGHVSKWLSFFNIPYEELIDRKINARYYVDDRAIKFVDWKGVLKAISL